MWQDWVNAVLGVWIVVVAYLNMAGSSQKTTLLITGIVVLILGVWGAMEKKTS